jgi:4-hydroxy-3-methylbut-2-en-1-yl diphosphate reductase
MGFKEEKAQVEATMAQEFTSPLVAEMRANGGVIKRGDLTVKLAEHYGFCWGVERAVSSHQLFTCKRFVQLKYAF